MHIIKRFIDLKRLLNDKQKRSPNQIVGFVPTMGALHEGHISLIKKSCIDCNTSICSIFVNPTQFGESNDLEKYPKPIEKEIELLVNNGCDILFLPTVEEVYPATYTHQNFDLGGIDLVFEGKSRYSEFKHFVLFEYCASKVRTSGCSRCANNELSKNNGMIKTNRFLIPFII